ncbi:hypothetical protein [Parapedobacter indicus]|uniref:Lipoprotein n=1 Tax=Parapedobacter indicus TaxID=1477437 RepID=A0A1I3QSC6_9SPHI|nr:hypothetical protein [Parapedobacter indicus]PPL00232.1 hypothetical protein CLV26_109110 [Parapedobacter indicus]SFJ37173.1 hypothetical protein SAMN05444682_109110 [Parapedobacter indicus]
MRIIVSIALVGSLAIACQQSQKQQKEETPAADPNAITCAGIGPVKLSDSYASLDSTIGADKLENGTAQVDGKTVHITKVFPNEAEEITVYWAESQEPYVTVTKIAVANNFGPYQTAEGLRVGSTLNDLKQYNNFMPISMTNFYNSLDGFAIITGFNGGDIETNYPCLGGKLDIVKQRGVDVRTLDEIKPEAELKSSHKLFNSIDVEVVELNISRK